jgi:hypothetical protein
VLSDFAPFADKLLTSELPPARSLYRHRKVLSDDPLDVARLPGAGRGMRVASSKIAPAAGDAVATFVTIGVLEPRRTFESSRELNVLSRDIGKARA